MKLVPVLLAVICCFVSPALTASDEFTTDTPSPLKLAKRGSDDATIARFTGSARISGRFVAAWEVLIQTPRHLRVVFLPDDVSARLLPHAVGSPAVKELLLSNNEPAARMLLGPDASRLLAKEVLALDGEATVTIGDYRSVIDCDHRWYLAQLVSVSNTRGIAVAARDSTRGC
jgi:hypothetical protein